MVLQFADSTLWLCVKKDFSLEQLQHNFSCQLFTTHPNTVRNAMTTSLLHSKFFTFWTSQKVCLSEEKKEEVLAMGNSVLVMNVTILQCHSIYASKRIEDRHCSRINEQYEYNFTYIHTYIPLICAIGLPLPMRITLSKNRSRRLITLLIHLHINHSVNIW